MADEPTAIHTPNLCAWASACRPHDGQACSCTCHPENRGSGTLPYGMKLLNPTPEVTLEVSGDLTAGDVIARWSVAHRERLTGDRIGPVRSDYSFADAVLAALAAAGWELHRAGEVVPTSDVLGLAQQWDEEARSVGLDDSGQFAAELRALIEQEPR